VVKKINSCECYYELFGFKKGADFAEVELKKGDDESTVAVALKRISFSISSYCFESASW
jgi:hypothetical protein